MTFPTDPSRDPLRTSVGSCSLSLLVFSLPILLLFHRRGGLRLPPQYFRGGGPGDEEGTVEFFARQGFRQESPRKRIKIHTALLSSFILLMKCDHWSFHGFLYYKNQQANQAQQSISMLF